MKVISKRLGKGKTTELCRECIKYIEDTRPDEVYFINSAPNYALFAFESVMPEEVWKFGVDYKKLQINYEDTIVNFIPLDKFLKMKDKVNKITFIDDMNLSLDLYKTVFGKVVSFTVDK